MEQELDSVILVSPFQLGVLCDSVFLQFGNAASPRAFSVVCIYFDYSLLQCHLRKLYRKQSFPGS